MAYDTGVSSSVDSAAQREAQAQAQALKAQAQQTYFGAPNPQNPGQWGYTTGAPSSTPTQNVPTKVNPLQSSGYLRPIPASPANAIARDPYLAPYARTPAQLPAPLPGGKRLFTPPLESAQYTTLSTPRIAPPVTPEVSGGSYLQPRAKVAVGAPEAPFPAGPPESGATITPSADAYRAPQREAADALNKAADTYRALVASNASPGQLAAAKQQYSDAANRKAAAAYDAGYRPVYMTDAFGMPQRWADARARMDANLGLSSRARGMRFGDPNAPPVETVGDWNRNGAPAKTTSPDTMSQWRNRMDTRTDYDRFLAERGISPSESGRERLKAEDAAIGAAERKVDAGQELTPGEMAILKSHQVRREKYDRVPAIGPGSVTDRAVRQANAVSAEYGQLNKELEILRWKRDTEGMKAKRAEIRAFKDETGASRGYEGVLKNQLDRLEGERQEMARIQRGGKPKEVVVTPKAEVPKPEERAAEKTKEEEDKKKKKGIVQTGERGNRRVYTG